MVGLPLKRTGPGTPAAEVTPQVSARRWPIFHLFRGQRTAGADAQVQAWKDAWVAGAQARWASQPVDVNPKQADSPVAAAWTAGWRWAEQQPDRRQPSRVRFAHPYRRSTDTTARFMRKAQAGAVGVSLLTLAAWMWQMRRRADRTR